MVYFYTETLHFYLIIIFKGKLYLFSNRITGKAQFVNTAKLFFLYVTKLRLGGWLVTLLDLPNII